jgi:benzoate transport
MSADPREIVANSPMSRLQVVVVGLTILLNALDGFDVLSISFASPGIMREWGINRAALGIVLSMELIGMAIGSIFLGGVADKIGRRPTVLGCLVVMAGGMYAATTATDIYTLSAWRIITGLGIGGMLAAINAVAAEFSNARRRHLSISLMAIGYPLGAVFGGMVARELLKDNDWRAVFYFGSAVTAVLIPVVYVLVPESVHWLARKQPSGALERINATLSKMGHAAVAALPTMSAEVKGKSVGDIFTGTLRRTTILVTLAYFLHITTFYYILKWIPEIVVRFGFDPSTAAGVLVWTNVGGATGGALFGLLTLRYNVKALTIAMLVLSTIAVTIFGTSSADLQQLSIVSAIAGFCANAGIVGLYAILAQAFPTHVRASGTGFAVGVGRGGSVIAPIIAGFLFEGGLALPLVSLALGTCSVLGAIALYFLRLDSDRVAAAR